MPRGKAKLSYTFYIAVPPSKVWRGLTDGSVTKEYFYGCRVQSSFAKGSPITYFGEGDFKMLDGKILEIEPNKRLVATFHAQWDEGVAKDPPSRVTWELAAAGEATKLTLVHDDFRGGEASFEQSASGWPLILSSLKTFLETGKALKTA
jgi:uncharacterized protein YndB with AHSA1/START domain